MSGFPDRVRAPAARLALLLDMEQNPRGASILTRGRIERFTESLDSDYDPIRRMAKTAERVAL